MAMTNVSPARRLEGIRVLVVDDDTDSLDLVSALLRRHGAEIDAASSMEQALKLLRRRRPHVLVTDMCMPGADGVELLEEMQRLFGDIPAIATTGQTVMMDRSLAIAAGFETQLIKPYQATELIRTIATIVGR